MRVNFQQHVARFDTLVVRHQQLHDRAGNAGADKGDVTVNEGVVGCFVGRDIADIIEGCCGGGQREHGNNNQTGRNGRGAAGKEAVSATRERGAGLDWFIEVFFFHQPPDLAW